MNDLYREIAETVNEMIPEEWDKGFIFTHKFRKTGGGTYTFFYNTALK